MNNIGRFPLQILMNATTTRVKMEQHVPTLKEVISANVNQVSRERDVNKVIFVFSTGHSL